MVQIETYAYYIRLIISGLMPIGLSILFCILLQKTKFKNLSKWTKQLIIGLSFGLFSILASIMTISQDLSLINLRDAFPLCAGIIFGGPAGIISGFIGGISRYIIGCFGYGEYTQLACSIATVLAGFYAALLKQFIFAKHRPTISLGFASAVVMEVIHMFLIFLTHLNSPYDSLEIIKQILIQMAIGNGIAVSISILAHNIIYQNIKNEKYRFRSITNKIQFWLFIAVVICLALSFASTFTIQTGVAKSIAEKQINYTFLSITSGVNNSVNEQITNEINDTHNTIDSLYTNNDCSPNNENEIIYESMDDEIQEVIIKNTLIKTVFITDNNNIVVHSTDYSFVNKNINELVTTSNVKDYTQDNLFKDSDSRKDNKYGKTKLTNGGYLYLELNENSIEKLVKDRLDFLSTYQTIGNYGLVLIIDNETNTIVNFSDSYIEFDDIVTDKPLSEINESDTFNASIADSACFCKLSIYDKYTFLGAISYSGMYDTRENSLYISSMIEILIFAIVYAIIYILIHRIVLKKLNEVNSQLTKISDGNLDTTIETDGTKEFEHLADNINLTVNTLKKYMLSEKNKIKEELELAKTIQSSSLPNIYPAFPNVDSFDIFARMDPARDVGGDFYDYFMLGESRLCFLIADVSGKGVPASLFMMQSKTIINNLISSGMDIDEAITEANHNLCTHNNAGMFVTAFIAILDLDTGHIDYVNAGHNPPLIYHKDGNYEYLSTKPCFVLAGLDGYKYTSKSVELAPGDKIFLYTDGVTEANDISQKMYGENRLIRILNNSKELSTKDTTSAVINDLREFVGESEQFDDITMLSLEYTSLNKDNIYEIEKEFDASLNQLENVLDFIEESIKTINADMKYLSKLNIVSEEIFVNIARYAYKGMGKNGKAWITFSYNFDNKELTLKFLDEGIPFNPLKKEDPDITLSAQEREIGGLGIYMVKKIMNTVNYERVNGENILITKQIID